MKRTAHRQERETPQRERTELKQQNRVLRRQVAQLQKQVRQLEELQPDDPEPMATDAEHEETSKPCPLCGKPSLATYKSPTNTVLIGCKSCKKYRGTIPVST